MYYKLYIDSVFVLQMATNLCLLSLAGRILKCTATHRRICIGAVTGAVLSCAVMVIPIGRVGFRTFISAFPVNMCMLYVVFRIRRGKKLIHASLVMAGCGFFLGSIMIWVLNRFRMILKGEVSLFLMLIIQYLSYCIMVRILKALRNKKESSLRMVEIYVPALDRKLKARALLDTGNHLADPVSGAPVCLVSEKLAGEISSCFLPEKYHVVPFRSVGRDRGILHGYELPELEVEKQGQMIRKEHVIVAVCDTGIPKDSIYQMILHPRLLED